MEKEIKEALKPLFDETKQNTEILRARLHDIGDKLQSCLLPLMLLQKDYDQINKNIEGILKELEKACSALLKMNAILMDVTPNAIITRLLSNWKIILVMVAVLSASGIDITAIFLELKKHI